MAVSGKLLVTAKPVAIKTTGRTKKNSKLIAASPSGVSEETQDQQLPARVSEIVAGNLAPDASPPEETPEAISPILAGPSALLNSNQVTTLNEQIQALGNQCMELLQAVAAERDARAAAESELVELRQAAARDLADLRDLHAQAIADLRASYERELADVRQKRLDIEREAAVSRRPVSGFGEKEGGRLMSGAADAVRLLHLLETRLAAGSVLPVRNASEALVEFGAAGMIDAIEGTRDVPACRGWLLSRTDLSVKPLIFLMDDDGLLGWTSANQDRVDVNAAFPNSKPRPGFSVALSRVPVGALRGIVAVDLRDGGGAVFFEAASRALPEILFGD